MGLPRDRLSSWLAGPRGSGEAGGGETPSAKASDAWRTWLMTGTRRPPFDRRRVSGAHRGLKKLMIEGTTSPPDRSLPWNDFSAAMIRQAVDEALNALPSSHKQAVKLAYFGGLTNQEIAENLGMGEDAVKRMLQVAIATVSAHVERGKTTTRKVIYFLAIWVGGRRLIDFLRHLPPAVDQVAQASVIVAAGVVTASVLVSHSPSPVPLPVTVPTPSAALPTPPPLPTPPTLPTPP